MGELLVPLLVFVVGPLASGAVILIARLTHSELHPVTAASPGSAGPRPATPRPRTLPASLPRTEISRG